MNHVSGLMWSFNPGPRQISATLHCGRTMVIAHVYSDTVLTLKGISSRPGTGDANGRLMASALALVDALGDLLGAAAGVLGEGHPEVIRSRALVAGIVADSLR